MSTCAYVTCAQCGVSFVRCSNRGTVPKFCTAACRQRAHRSVPPTVDVARQVETLLRLADILDTHAATYRAEAATLAATLEVPA